MIERECLLRSFRTRQESEKVERESVEREKVERERGPCTVGSREEKGRKEASLRDLHPTLSLLFSPPALVRFIPR